MQNNHFKSLLSRYYNNLLSGYQNQKNLLEVYECDFMQTLNVLESVPYPFEKRIHRLIICYQQLLILQYAAKALSIIQNKIDQFLSLYYQHPYFDEEFKCCISTFKYFTLFLPQIGQQDQFLQEYEKILNLRQDIQYDSFISTDIMKIMDLEQLKHYYYFIFHQKWTLNLNNFHPLVQQNLQIDYQNLKFTFTNSSQIIPHYQQNYSNYSFQQPYVQQQTNYNYVPQPQILGYHNNQQQSQFPQYQQQYIQTNYTQNTHNQFNNFNQQSQLQYNSQNQFNSQNNVGQQFAPQPQILTKREEYYPLISQHYQQQQNQNEYVNQQQYYQGSQVNNNASNFNYPMNSAEEHQNQVAAQLDDQQQQKQSQIESNSQIQITDSVFQDLKNQPEKSEEVLKQTISKHLEQFQQNSQSQLDDAQFQMSQQAILEQYQQKEKQLQSEVETLFLSKSFIGNRLIDSNQQPILRSQNYFHQKSIKNDQDEKSIKILEDYFQTKPKILNQEQQLQRSRELRQLLDF